MGFFFNNMEDLINTDKNVVFIVSYTSWVHD